MQRDPLPVAGLDIALLLVSAPLWVFPRAGDASTAYAAGRIEYGPEAGGYIDAGGPIRGLDCYADELTRGRLFVRRLLAEAPVTVGPPDLVGSPSAFEDAPPWPSAAIPRSTAAG